LGVISNWDERLVPLLRDLGLRNYFEAVAGIVRSPFSKPSPVIFQQQRKSSGWHRKKILHVGDDLTRDVSALEGAGMQTLWLRRGATQVKVINQLH